MAQISDNKAPQQALTPAPLAVIGIGASAGGLEALTQLLANLTAPIDAAIVVVQHVSPDHRSLLTDLLSRETSLKVTEIQHLEPLLSNHVHVTPPNSNVQIIDGRFHLSRPNPEFHPKPSINLFFQSLAQNYATRAIAIVLSGTGTDGAEGCLAVKRAGGTVLVQQPESAKYPGMPLSTIEHSPVDCIVPATELGTELAHCLASLQPGTTTFINTPYDLEKINELLELVHKQTGIDFRDYKDATLQRRIARRMASCKQQSVEDYVEFVKNSPTELINLQKDILISVTSFFRDGFAFEELEKVIRQILIRKNPGDEFRVWVPGCATGEEIYSIGIVICELLGDTIEKYKVQLFATDIDADALRIARAGIYSAESLKRVSTTMIDKYFENYGDKYEVKKKIRDMVVFAKQDLVVDPPFLRQDLISCRNVMIYFKADLQNRVLTTFHYSLAPKGVLFLGKSESVFQKEDLFDTLSREGKIYSKRDSLIKVLPNTYRSTVKTKPTKNPENADIKNPFRLLIESTAIAQFLPQGIIYNDAFVIQYVHGDCSSIISLPEGRPSLDLDHVLRKELQGQLHALTRRANLFGKLVHGPIKEVSIGKQTKEIEIFVTKINEGSISNLYLLGFNHSNNKKKLPAKTITSHAAEEELAATRDHLQRAIEELEGSNEEMQALNEEVQASNEELQSMNEELEASNEELQSANEELITVNEELQIKTLQNQKLLNELQCIQNSLDFPLLVVDKSLSITKFNNAAARTFQINGGASAKVLVDINLGTNTGLMDAALKVMVSGGVFDLEITDHQNRTYLTHIAPYSGEDTDGAILLFIDQTESLQLNKNLQKHEQWLRTLMDHSAALFSVKDISGRYTFINKPFAEAFSIEQDKIVGKTDSLLFSDERCKWVRDHELEVLRQGNSVACEEEIIIHGTPHYFWSVRFPLLDQSGLIQAICFQATDISLRREMEIQTRLSASVFERSMEAVVVTDSTLSIIKTNEAFSRLTGFESRQVIGKDIHSLFCLNPPDKNITPLIRMGDNWQGATWLNHRNEQQRLFWFSINAVLNKDDVTMNHVALFYDITEQHQHEEKIQHLATHDELTGLPNRVLLRDRLDQLLSRGHRHKTFFAVFFIDLDDFKLINDTHGHEAGDELLQQVSIRLSNIVRSQDTIARIGGDEFVIVQEFSSKDHPGAMAVKILNSLHTPIMLSPTVECFANASIGISLYPQDGQTAVELMRGADTAMYRAKNAGPGLYEFFKPEMAVDINQRLEIINGLRDAAAKNEFTIALQPQLKTDSKIVTGVEILLRWTHKNQPIPPTDFIPLAESAGLMHTIGHWVLAKACQTLAQFSEMGFSTLTVSVNVSTKQFTSDHFVDDLLRLIEDHGVNANLLIIEVTESAVINFEKSIESMLRLRNAGIQISLDDFGTGYSSLTYLKKLPIQELKIDRCFVDGIGIDADDLAITAAILALAKQLDLRVVAEGVENIVQLDKLNGLACDYVQGFYFSKPLEFKLFMDWYKSYSAQRLRTHP